MRLNGQASDGLIRIDPGSHSHQTEEFRDNANNSPGGPIPPTS
jgi:hypothetical protein